jgi:hypothetical protein
MNRRFGPLRPERFLRELPVLNAYDWWDWYEGVQLRDDVNYELLTKVSKAKIVAAARRRPELIRQYVVEREAGPVAAYDLDADRAGVWGWYRATSVFAARNPLALAAPTSNHEFMSVITAVVDAFAHFVEERGGWRLLWNDDGSDKDEAAAQLVFYGIAQPYCAANGIVVDREVNLGRGPVDFKFSNGFERRALLEVKKLSNGKFWNGLDAQLPSYMKSDKCKEGWLLAIKLRSDGVSVARAERLPVEVRSTIDRTKLTIRYLLVDATPKQSASKLSRKR